jgi:SAM-dependent methyltransferase
MALTNSRVLCEDRRQPCADLVEGDNVDSAGWDKRYAGTDLIWSAEPNRFVVQELSRLEPGRALDLATGEGRNAVWLAELGWAVTGADFSAVGLAKARKIAEARGVTVEWVTADVVDYTPEPDWFDLVLIAYLQLPEQQRAKVLGHAAAALAPGGTLLVICHDLDNLAHGVGGPQDPAVLCTAPAIVAALGGLEIVSAGQVQRPVLVEGEARTAIDTLVRATRKPARH